MTSRTQQLIAAAVIGLSVLQYFRLLFTSLAVCVLAIGLSLHPGFRILVDELLGSKSIEGPTVSSHKQRVHEEVKQIFLGPSEITQLVVPQAIEQPLDVLLNLIIRDFIDAWYSQNVSLGDRRFPAQARSILNGIVNALNVRIQALDAREAGIYLIHSLSNALVSDIKRQKSTGEGKDGQQQRDQEMISKLRAVSEELLLVSTPPAASSAPAFIALMTEVLTLQLWKTITSLDADFVNLTILGRTNHVSTTTPKTIRRRSFGPLVDLASSPKPTQTSFRIDPLPSPLSPASITSSHSEAGPPDMRQAIDVFTKGPSEVTANLLQQIELYLAEHPRQTIESHQTPSVRILQMVLTGQNEELADRFQDHIDTLDSDRRVQGHALMRSYGQIESFKKVIEMHPPANEASMKQDSIAVLARICQSLYTADMGTDEELQQVLAATLVALAGTKPKSSGLDLLQKWIATRLEEDFFHPFMDNRQSRPTTPARSRSVTPARSPRSLSPERPVTALSSASLSSLANSTISSSFQASSPRASTSSSRSDVSVASTAQLEVTVTDLSEPSAYDDRQHVRSKRDLLYLIAVETVDGTPSYILQRSHNEIERMDVSLPGSSTSLTKPTLPTVAAKTSTEITKGLEIYLAAILSNPKLFQAKAATDFFKRERANSAGSANPSAPATPKVDFVDRDLDELAEKVVNKVEGAIKGFAKTGKLASKGLSSFGSMLSDFSLLSPELTSPAVSRPPSIAPRSRRGSEHLMASGMNSAASSRRPSVSSIAVSTTSVDSEKPSSSQLAASLNALPPSQSEPALSRKSSSIAPLNLDLDTPMPTKTEDPFSAPPSVFAPDDDHISDIPIPKEAATAPTAAHRPLLSKGVDTEITPTDFEHLINSMLSVLNSAYQLTDGQWSLKRGILKVIETVLRTSYQGPIKIAFSQLCATADAESIGKKIEELQESFWPDGVWHSTVRPMEVRSAEEKEETRKQAREVFIAQAPEGLKIALGANSTAEAFGRIHDALQGEGNRLLVYTALIDGLRLILL